VLNMNGFYQAIHTIKGGLNTKTTASIIMNSTRAIDAWCKKATALEKQLGHCAEDYSAIVEDYEEMRNKTSDLNKAAGDEAKEKIDEVFSKVFDAHKRLCAVRAGGTRRRRGGAAARRGATRRRRSV